MSAQLVQQSRRQFLLQPQHIDALGTALATALSRDTTVPLCGWRLYHQSLVLGSPWESNGLGLEGWHRQSVSACYFEKCKSFCTQLFWCIGAVRF